MLHYFIGQSAYGDHMLAGLCFIALLDLLLIISKQLIDPINMLGNSIKCNKHAVAVQVRSAQEGSIAAMFF